jgi:hypothetical protein
MIRVWLLVALASVVLGCGNGGEKSPSTPPPSPSATAPAGASPTPLARASPPAGQCPVAQDVCVFASSIARAVTDGNVDALVSAAQLREYSCPATRPQGLGGPYPLCDNAAAGEKRQGFQIAYLASEGQVLDAAGLRDAIRRWLQSGLSATTSDQYGAGGNRLFSVGCVAGIVPCGNQVVLVFSQRQASIPTRIELLLYFERLQSTGQPRLTFVAVGPLLRPEEEAAALKGGSYPAFLAPQGWPPIQTFYPLP